MGFPCHNRLRMGEFPEAPFSVIGAHTGMPRPAKRHALHHHMNTNLIDASASVLLCTHYIVRPPEIFCKKIKRQWMLAFRHRIKNFIYLGIFEWNHRQNRTEQFMLYELVVFINRVNNRRRELLCFLNTRSAEINPASIFFRYLVAFRINRAGYQFRIFFIFFRLFTDLSDKFRF